MYSALPEVILDHLVLKARILLYAGVPGFLLRYEVFSLALAYQVAIASSQISTQSLQRKQVISNPYRYSIHGMERCELPFTQYRRTTREKSRLPALNTSCEISSKLLTHHPKRPLLIRKHQLGYALKKHQHFQAALSQGGVLAALLSAMSLVISHE